jgi:hypothetical protein
MDIGISPAAVTVPVMCPEVEQEFEGARTTPAIALPF